MRLARHSVTHHPHPLGTQIYPCTVFNGLGNKKKRKQTILHPALLWWREWCGHHPLQSCFLHVWVACLRAACTYTCLLVGQGPGWVVHSSLLWPWWTLLLRLSRGGGSGGGGLGNEQAEQLQSAAW